MSAHRELNHPDDFVILTVDVANSPLGKLRLAQIYDVETSILNDDYLSVIQDFVTQQLENTHGLDLRSRSRLLDAPFCTLHRRGNGDLLSLRKPATERLIRQTIQGRMDVFIPVSVSILIQFKTPGFRFFRRLHESTRLSPKICEEERTIDDGNHARAAPFRSRGVDISSEEPVAPHITLANSNHLIFNRTAKNDHDKSDSGLPILLLGDSNNGDIAFTRRKSDGVNFATTRIGDVPFTSTNGVGMNNFVTTSIKSLKHLTTGSQHCPVSDGYVLDNMNATPVFANATAGSLIFSSVTDTIGKPPRISNVNDAEEGTLALSTDNESNVIISVTFVRFLTNKSTEHAVVVTGNDGATGTSKTVVRSLVSAPYFGSVSLTMLEQLHTPSHNVKIQVTRGTNIHVSVGRRIINAAALHQVLFVFTDAYTTDGFTVDASNLPHVLFIEQEYDNIRDASGTTSYTTDCIDDAGNTCEDSDDNVISGTPTAEI